MRVYDSYYLMYLRTGGGKYVALLQFGRWTTLSREALSAAPMSINATKGPEFAECVNCPPVKTSRDELEDT